MNLHLRVTQAEYDGILREARKQGLNPKVQPGSKGPLFATLEVKLFVSPSARLYKYATINDPTYSRTVMQIESEV